jgi:rhodanese-related sulfurtransferase
MPIADTIDTAQLRQLIHEDPEIRILDVRTGGEFETVHIPGSYNVPLDTLNEHAGDLADVTRPVVLVCQSGGRATLAHATLAGEGKNGLHILEGGMSSWLASGGDVVRSPSERWAMDRQVRLAAGAMALVAVMLSAFAPKVKWLAAGVGAGLFYSAVSDTCAMASILAKLPYNRGKACDIVGVLDDLNRKED